jgi:exodeoxyribonuclease VII small subunit
MASFEEALSKLEALVEELERPDVPLERALVLFEEGIEHLRVATAELSRAEASVKVLVAKAGGVLQVNELHG